jgi:hypothetical protein
MVFFFLTYLIILKSTPISIGSQFEAQKLDESNKKASLFSSCAAP